MFWLVFWWFDRSGFSMPARSRSRRIINVFAVLLMLVCAWPVCAQEVDDEFGDDAADPVKVFNRGQDAHDKGDLQLALEFYEEALRMRPDFPEAEFQKAQALRGLQREPEAEQSYRRAAQLRPDWAMPPTALGMMLVQQKRDADAEPLLRRALELDAGNRSALTTLADLRLRAGDKQGALQLWRQATGEKFDADTSIELWRARCDIESTVDSKNGLACFDRLLAADPDFVPGRLKRAELRIEAGNLDGALDDLRAVEASWQNKRVPPPTILEQVLALASLFARAGQKDYALEILNRLDTETPEATALREQIILSTAGGDSPEARATLEKIVAREPRNASALAQLGAMYRTVDAARSLQLYQQAVEIEPRNVDYATGYGAALVQSRSFDRAVVVLQQVVAAAPDNYAAHANLATALDELKQYRAALAEYRWINQRRPELAVTYFFIARAHDLLGEYAEALAAYEAFLARADVQTNRLEVDKVNLRLPTLRNQIKRGEGAKKKGKD